MKSSRIARRENERFIQIREDYLHLVNGDACAAAMLALFEFWTNGKAEHATTDDDEEVWITGKTAQDISDRLLNLYNEKSVRERLKKLGDLGFIQTRSTVKHRKTLDYLLCESRLGQALQELWASKPTVKPAKPTGKNTAGRQKVKPNGKNTVNPTVKTPLETEKANGKNAVALYIRSSFLEEETQEESGNPPSPVPQPSPAQERVCVEAAKLPENPETTNLSTASLTTNQPTPPPTQELTRPDRAVRPATLPSTVDLPPLNRQVHPTEKCDRQFDPIAPWRISRKRNDYKFDFCTYLRTHYLPTVAPWRDATPPTTGDTKNWIARREFDEKGLSEIENKWGDFREWQAEEAKKDQATIDAGIPTDQDEFIALMRSPDFLERTHPKYRRAG